MSTSESERLVPLPAQPAGVPWPTDEWPTGPVPAGVDLEPLLDEVMDPAGPLSDTYAVVVISGGRLVAERYGGALPSFTSDPTPVTVGVPLLSWSMAKSMLHCVVGMLVDEGALELDAPAPVPEWSSPGDPRGAITLEQLLAMRDGLDFAEDYVDARASDVIEMLFGSGVDDVAHFAADRPLAAPPGERFNYSSGTSNIVSGIVARVIGGGEPYEAFVRSRLFEPIGMRTARATFDTAGTWIASSYVHATAQDFARFGLLALRDGVWDGRRLLPEGWIDHGRRVRSVDPDDGQLYGAHWWVHGDAHGTFRASGYEGQRIIVCPALDLVVVRLGRTPAERYPNLREWSDRIVTEFSKSQHEWSVTQPGAPG
ncbi:MAG TPA: serine hydrolase [Acidimicrobiales bacterium]|nr:serine hydrolase [Acidimicrobiales bacterium]